jgi:Putative zinc- or iron-chelating domain
LKYTLCVDTVASSLCSRDFRSLIACRRNQRLRRSTMLSETTAGRSSIRRREAAQNWDDWSRGRRAPQPSPNSAIVRQSDGRKMLMTAQCAETSRSSEFGYVCRRCSLCCRDKRIQINPYELARLARAQGETTSEFRERWTLDGQGTTLGQKEDGTCVFLGSQGCEVHADRPLVCRLCLKPLRTSVPSDSAIRS